jgi:hypothetical protein
MPATLVKSKKKVLPKEMSKALQEYFHLSASLVEATDMKDDLIELEEKLVCGRPWQYCSVAISTINTACLPCRL